MTAGPIDHCYWTRSAPGEGFPELHGDIAADVAIVGAGIVGVIAARLLRDRGLTVALIEGERVGRGVTGRSTAKVTAQHGLFLQRIERDHGADAARAYAEANRAGVELIAGLVERHRLACAFEPADSVVYATTAEGAVALARERDAAARAGLPMTLAEAADLPFATRGALVLARQAQFQPVDFVAQLAATIPGDGSAVFENSRAIDWSDSTVRTARGAVRARRVIMATHLPLGQVGQFHAHTHPHMHAILALPVDPARAPPGMYISADEPKRSLRRHRAASGETVLILTGPRFVHGDAQAEREGFAALAAFAAEHFGCAGGGWRWSNEDYTPRDGLPYVGWSGAAGESLLVATGFDAWGLSNGAAAAGILADLCEGRDNRWAACFDAGRHSLKGLGQLAANAAKVTADLVAGHLRRLPDAATADEGEIVEIDGRAAGVFRGADGRPAAVSVVCTHMGCHLGWNPVDRTWDCPCHGSRFAADGRVLHGPAIEPLSRIDWPEGRKEPTP